MLFVLQVMNAVGNLTSMGNMTSVEKKIIVSSGSPTNVTKKSSPEKTTKPGKVKKTEMVAADEDDGVSSSSEDKEPVPRKQFKSGSVIANLAAEAAIVKERQACGDKARKRKQTAKAAAMELARDIKKKIAREAVEKKAQQRQAAKKAAAKSSDDETQDKEEEVSAAKPVEAGPAAAKPVEAGSSAPAPAPAPDSTAAAPAE